MDNGFSPFYSTIIALISCGGAWTALVELIKWLVGRKTGIKKDIKDIDMQVKTMRSELDEERKERLEDRTVSIRSRIVRFNDELLINKKHSKSMFDTILMDCTVYEQYCSAHPEFRNGVATEAISNIKRCYRECEKTNSFL